MSHEKIAVTTISEEISQSFVRSIEQIINDAKNNAVRSVNFCRVQMYWQIGKRIIEEEQQGKSRADYGTFLLTNLSKELEPEYGSGFSYRQLAFCRQFFVEYPIMNALRSQLNWSQYRMLIQIPDKEKRLYYELESVNNNWTGRELERQINSQLYERLLLSTDKNKVLSVARKERIPEEAKEIIKDPMILEFLGLERLPLYYESDLENALLSHLQQFLLELGNGFTFVARQKRLLIEDDEFFADLVFYNRILRSFVIVELKTGKLTHQDLGQLQMYVNYYDRTQKLPDENPTIGIILCSNKNDTAVRMTLPENNNTIMASQYKLYLPSNEQLANELNEYKQQIQSTREANHKEEGK